jgi:hypothetical protein
MLTLSRLVGLAASVGVISLWSIFSFLNPYGYEGMSSAVYLIAALMIVLGVVGIVAVLTERSRLMVAVFVLSFVPIGFYLLGAPGLFRWIGIFNILFLLSGLVMLALRHKRPPQSWN